MLLLLAVLPANVHMASARLPIGGMAIPAWVLWARLPFQLVLLAWVLVVSGAAGAQTWR